MSVKTVVQLILFTLIVVIFYVFYFIYFKKNVSEINQSTQEENVKKELSLAQESKILNISLQIKVAMTIFLKLK